jgi:regulatory protein
MIITAIERQKKRAQRFNVFIDGEFALGTSASTLLKFGLRKGDAVDERTVNTIRNFEDFTAAKEKALRLIAHRLRSESELKKRLQEKGFEPSVIQQVMANLREAKLIDDRAFALAFSHDFMLKKPSGKRLLERQLFMKGISKELIHEVAESISPEIEKKEALEAAAKLLKRYSVSRKKSDAQKQRQRITAFLTRRGYEYSTVRMVTKKLFSTIDEPDESNF